MAKINNETKIALLAIAAVGLGIWGFKFLKGINVLTTSRTFYIKYENVDQLRPSSPVFINGLQVGMVKALDIDKNDDRTIIATINIDSDADIPKDAVALIVGQSIMGGKAIDLLIPHPCDGDDCAENGDYLLGGYKSFLKTILGDPEQLREYTDKLQIGLTTVWDSIADPDDPKGVGRSLLSLERSLANIEVLTLKLSQLIDASSKGLTATSNNTAELTRALASNSEDISNTLKNLSEISNQLKSAGLDKSSQKATQAIDSLTASLATMRTTLNTTTRTVARVDTIAQGLLAGKGLAGKTLTDEELYDNLVKTSQHLQLLMQDLRLNPTRYTTVKLKLFGKNKPKTYDVSDDPALRQLQDSLGRDTGNK